jgi:7-cyano-7-deazaguanine synthase
VTTPDALTSPPEIAVLLSGGIDSMACADFYRTMGRPICGIFVDYGQAAAQWEAAAASAVAQHLDIRLLKLTISNAREKTLGEIAARNAFLLSVAAMERPPSVLALAIGLHAGTPYSDCTGQFLESAKTVLSYQSKPVDVLAPFIDWRKEDIVAYSLKRRLPIEITYSCEAGSHPPCGRCLSCLDRREIDARP